MIRRFFLLSRNKNARSFQNFHETQGRGAQTADNRVEKNARWLRDVDQSRPDLPANAIRKRTFIRRISNDTAIFDEQLLILYLIIPEKFKILICTALTTTNLTTQPGGQTRRRDLSRNARLPTSQLAHVASLFLAGLSFGKTQTRLC